MKELQSLNFGKLSILELGQNVKSVNSGVAALGIVADVDLLR